jgi:hypothetical protein
MRRIPDELVEVDNGRWEELVVFLERSNEQWEEVYSDGSASFFDPIEPTAGFLERYGA